MKTSDLLQDQFLGEEGDIRQQLRNLRIDLDLLRAWLSEPRQEKLDFRALDFSTGSLRMIMSAISILDELGIQAHFAGFAPDGTPTFWVDADTGAMTWAAQNGQLDAEGAKLQIGTSAMTPGSEDKTKSLSWYDGSFATAGNKKAAISAAKHAIGGANFITTILSALTANVRAWTKNTTTGYAGLFGHKSDGTEVSVTASGETESIEVTHPVRLPEQSAPGTPASGYGYIYADTNGDLRHKNDAGTDVKLNGIFPQSCLLFAQEFIFSATSVISNDASQRFGFFRGPLSANANDGDTIDISVCVEAGTYTLTLAGVSGVNCGKVDGYLDDSVSAEWTGDDWYSGSTTNNVLMTHSITFAQGGRHKIQLKVNGKNASSSDYRVLLTDAYLVPSSFSVEAE